MSLYLSNAPYRSMARRRMWEQMLNAETQQEQASLVFPVDVRVDDEGYTITALLPGVDADNLDVQIVNDTVTIQGELKVERKEEERYLVAERPSGNFKRTLEFPDDLDPEKSDAQLKNGVLTLRVPKSELAKPRKIKISNN